jgi:hypothetical protein
MRVAGTVTSKAIDVTSGLAQGAIEVAGHVGHGVIEFTGGAITTGVNGVKTAAGWVGDHAKDLLPWNW